MPDRPIEPLFISREHGGVRFIVRHDDAGWWVAFDDERTAGPFDTATQTEAYARRDIEDRHA